VRGSVPIDNSKPVFQLVASNFLSIHIYYPNLFSIRQYRSSLKWVSLF
jgi:hypothetical protein